MYIRSDIMIMITMGFINVTNFNILKMFKKTQ